MRLPGAMALALRKARRGKRRGGASGDAAQPRPGRDLGFLYTCPGLAPRPCRPRSLRQSPRGIARAIPPGQRQQRGQREQPLRQTSTSGEFLVGNFFFFFWQFLLQGKSCRELWGSKSVQPEVPSRLAGS